MAIRLEDKKAIVAEVNETAANALSLVIADARGVSVSKMDQLRKLARENNVRLQVVRNTLARRAVAGTSFECVSEVLKGPSIFGFSMEDPGACARLFKDFAKANDKFVVLGGFMGDKVLDAKGVEVLSKLPSLDQIRASLLGLLNAPATKIAGVVQAPAGQLARVFNAYATKDAA